jgi:hypothetical protein
MCGQNTLRSYPDKGHYMCGNFMCGGSIPFEDVGKSGILITLTHKSVTEKQRFPFHALLLVLYSGSSISIETTPTWKTLSTRGYSARNPYW